MRQGQTRIHRRIGWEGFTITYRRGKGVGLHIIPVLLVQGIGKEFTTSQVDWSGKPWIGTCFCVLRMPYLNIIVCGPAKVTESLLTLYQVFKTKVDVTFESIAFGIDGLPPESITSVGVVIPGNAKVYIIAKRKIIASVLNKVTPLRVISKCWKNQNLQLDPDPMENMQRVMQ